MSAEQTTTIVIFGASGDLTRRKLIPSLCSLFCKGRLGPEVQIVGMARRDMTSEGYRESLAEGMDGFDDFSLIWRNGPSLRPASTIAAATLLPPAT